MEITNRYLINEWACIHTAVPVTCISADQPHRVPRCCCSFPSRIFLATFTMLIENNLVVKCASTSEKWSTIYSFSPRRTNVALECLMSVHTPISLGNDFNVSSSASNCWHYRFFLSLILMFPVCITDTKIGRRILSVFEKGFLVKRPNQTG